MQAVTTTGATKDFMKIFNLTIENNEPVIIAEDGGESAVLLPLAEYENLKEHLHLLSDSVSRTRLFESIAQAEKGKLTNLFGGDTDD